MKKETATPFFVGTYTDGSSQGIYQYKLLEDGSLEASKLLAKTVNPSYLTRSQEGNYLLAVNEVSNDQTSGLVSSFQITKDSLILIDQSPSGGAHPCHITTNQQGYVVMANYTGGNMGLLRIDSEGRLSDLLDVQQHSGQGKHPRQEGPHAHFGAFDKAGKLISVDLGTNQLWFSFIDPENSKFIPGKPETFLMEEGAGPRHLTIHPDQPWMYVINELNSTVSLVKKDLEKDNYVIEQSISTLPDDFNGENSCADIHISSDGRFLYTSNRGHNSITIFAVDQGSGLLTRIALEPTRGETPRNFTLSPAEDYLLVANQTTNTIVSFSRDLETGLLVHVDEIEAPTPVCLLF